MIAAVLSLVALALVAPVVTRLQPRASGWILALLPAALTVAFALQIGHIADGGVRTDAWSWAPDLGVRLSFYLDGLSLLFALLVCGIGALVVFYAGGYLEGHRALGRFYALLLLFMAAMLGLVLADNLLTLFVFWELTSYTSFLLIGFEHERASARAAAQQALILTAAGGLALLGGLVLLGNAGGSFEFSELLAGDVSMEGDPLYLAILLLLLAGIVTKSAQFPFHFWLPAAMEAPTPVSAYLHSATMVKAGIYLALRVQPVMGGTDEWMFLLCLFGGATMLIGGYLSIRESDLKRILAYSTVSALGMIAFLIGLGTEHTIAAAVTYLLAHALYKGALFLMAGAVDHATGTRDINQLAGLARAMPVVAFAALAAALSMAGIPPLFGFIAKESAYAATSEVTVFPAALMLAVVVAGGVLFVVQAVLVGWRPFFGSRQQDPHEVHSLPLEVWLPPAVLASIGLAAGLLPALPGRWLLESAANAAAGADVGLHLVLWHGFNLALLLSIVTLALGVALYFALPALLRLRPPRAMAGWSGAGGFAGAMAGLNWVARQQTRVLQSGYLRFYLLFTGATVVLLTGFVLIRERVPLVADVTDARIYEIALVGVILFGALALARTRSLLVGVAALGVVGYGVALIYVLFGAPDLAMTQLLIETLTLVLLVLVFYFLPRPSWDIHWPTRIRDVVAALSVGGLMTVLVLAVQYAGRTSVVSQYYLEESVPAAHGRNVVNVILVDFRALDTLGEITVLAVAAVGVFAVLRLRRTSGRQ